VDQGQRVAERAAGRVVVNGYVHKVSSQLMDSPWAKSLGARAGLWLPTRS